jgi:hypothetical protein
MGCCGIPQDRDFLYSMLHTLILTAIRPPATMGKTSDAGA